MTYIVNLKDVNLRDRTIVGGKNASTGEMLQHLHHAGIQVPGGFAITVLAYRNFLTENGLDTQITKELSALKLNNVTALQKISQKIRAAILAAPFSSEFEKEVGDAYATLKNAAVAVRSSATTEDMEVASFAGQQETYLNIKGLKNLLKAIKLVYASLFSSRAIAYRHDQHFDHFDVALSVGVQPMIRSDKGASGVLFTVDTESGFDKVVLISASYGLGEAIVQGSVNPDEFFVYKNILTGHHYPILQKKLGEKAIKMIYNTSKDLKKSIKSVPVLQKDRMRFSITDADVQSLTASALLIEKHYGKAMDIEWAKDGITGEIFILQARPETVKSQTLKKHELERYILQEEGKVLVTGQSVGQKISAGPARVVLDPKKMNAVKPGDILVTDMTDPDWEPIMRRSAGIVTNRGGRTCHAAIIARELGIPAVIGCHDATEKIKTNQIITVSCAEGQVGKVYSSKLKFEVKKTSIKNLPELPVKLCINLGNPDIAFQTQFLPNHGVGLARIEFIISNMIGIHPNALLHFRSLSAKLKKEIQEKTLAYQNPLEFYVAKLSEGMAMIAAAFYPKPVIFRFSDFKTNEYANLLGGHLYEPLEENPMIGFRGASRYQDARFRRCFALECQAVKRVREKMGFQNAVVMIPFVRTVDELQKVIAILEENGLKRGENDLKIYMMCEIPSNVILAAEFLKYIDGYSIGSNDLTQLTLGLDRDSNIVASLFDERNDAVKKMLHDAITECIKQNKYIGICGQGPSDHPDFAEWLMQEGIQCISLNPDSILETWLQLLKKHNISA